MLANKIIHAMQIPAVINTLFALDSGSIKFEVIPGGGGARGRSITLKADGEAIALEVPCGVKLGCWNRSGKRCIRRKFYEWTFDIVLETQTSCSAVPFLCHISAGDTIIFEGE